MVAVLPQATELITFTRRERNILALIVQGSDVKEIAYKLELGWSTVKQHVAHICAKSGVARYNLAIYVLQHKNSLIRGGMCSRGLHPPGCRCNEFYCAARRAA